MTKSDTIFLDKLRTLMRFHHIDTYLVPGESVYKHILSYYKRPHWIKGFIEPTEFAIVTFSNATFVANCFFQEAHLLDDSWTLIKQEATESSALKDYLIKNVENGARIGFDPTFVINPVDSDYIIKEFETTGSSVIPISANLIDLITDKKHAEIPKNKVFTQPMTGRSIGEKLLELRFYLFGKKAHAMILSKDEVAWLFTITPSNKCNAIITKKEAFLYYKEMLSPSEKDHLTCVQIRPFSDFFHDCTILSTQLSEGTKLIITEKAYATIELAFNKNQIVKEEYSFIHSRKVLQTKSERDGTRTCYLRDGAAITSFLAWLENRLDDNKQLDIVEATNKLDQYRNLQEKYVGLRSFSISSSSSPSPSSSSTIPSDCDINQKIIIDPNCTLFIDSDGQYLDGNAKYTGTFYFKSSPGSFEKRCFTRILQAHIAMHQSIFPRGTTGDIIDSFGRQILWKEGLDTIASFINNNNDEVFDFSSQFDRIPLASGMVLSIEPHYKDDQHMICIRNAVMVKQIDTSCKNSSSLGLELVSFVPLCRRLIDVDLFSPQEREWINSYHTECFDRLSPLVDRKTVTWLKKETWPI